MRSILPYASIAASLALAVPALAQTAAKPATTTSVPPTPATSPSNPANPVAGPQPGDAVAPTTVNPLSAAPPAAASTGASSDTAANAGAGLVTGMSVKDSTGALIGEVKTVKNGVATIQMGADTFTVDSSKLGVANGVASINATQAELKRMLPGKK